MKTFKRFSAILLAVLLMVAMMAVPASATETLTPHTIYIANEETGHIYEVYQLFKGTLNASGIMTGITWGSGVSTEGQATLGSTDSIVSSLKTVADAENFGRQVGPYLENPIATISQVTENDGKKGYWVGGLDDGYYLIKDKDDSLNNTEHAYTQYIIQVVDNVEVSPKSSTATLLKDVSRNQSTGYAKATSVMIGGDAYYRLIASVPAHIHSYNQFYMKIEDVLPAGVSYVELVGIYAVNGEEYEDYTHSVPENYYVCAHVGQTVSITLKNAKDAIEAASGASILLEDKIMVIYKAKLNENAVIGMDSTGTGVDGNVNTAVMTYSNDPNEVYVDTPLHTGKTAKATATLYTYQVDLTKIGSGSDKPVLDGAQFVAYYKVGSTGTPQYLVVDTTGKVTHTVNSEENATKLTTANGGKLNIIGVPSGVLHLKEIVAPDGYNLPSVEFVVSINGSLDGTTGKLGTFSASITGTSEPVTVNKTTGTVYVTIPNRIGSTLPETGGIGTPIFYGIGGVLVIAALALLTVRKRSAAK